MPVQDLTTKLLLKHGMSAYVIDSPPSTEEIVRALSESARLVTDETQLPADLVCVFATSADQLRESLPTAIRAVRDDGLLWIAYPRVSSTGSHEISREGVHQVLAANGWRPVTQISMGDTWTAIRARPASAARRRN
jgi:Protein of unknown function (DUF3052)